MPEDIQTKVINFQTSGICAQAIQIQIFDDIVQNVVFVGGCPGNHQGITALVKGMSVDEVISRLSGIRCGDKESSCPDQLAKALILYKNKRFEFTTNKPQEQQEAQPQA